MRCARDADYRPGGSRPCKSRSHGSLGSYSSLGPRGDCSPRGTGRSHPGKRLNPTKGRKAGLPRDWSLDLETDISLSGAWTESQCAGVPALDQERPEWTSRAAVPWETPTSCQRVCRSLLACPMSRTNIHAKH
ncbi:hypothetical protein NDU88_003962 [Pleurodeles waltl]|uniref:Uncharacterized protein n=1 Tax=Pleurodeles waltl TaxID=8319 RepID=A0AAV7T6V9_PLEWA|nr:hypothetical protein NDU88_003962 [Pleurodeles waltl]